MVLYINSGEKNASKARSLDYNASQLSYLSSFFFSSIK